MAVAAHDKEIDRRIRGMGENGAGRIDLGRGDLLELYPGAVAGEMARDVSAVQLAIIEAQRAENARAAQSVVEKFEQAVHAAAVPGETHRIETPVTDAPKAFARIARHFDLAVVPQPEPEQPEAQL
jgi:hypothetical protein